MAQGVGRPSPMDDPEQQEEIAKMVGEGASRSEVAKVFNVHKDTVSRWVKRPDMQALVSTVRKAQSNRILRITNAAIMSRIETPESRAKLSLKELLDIHRAFQAPDSAGDDTTGAELALWALLDEEGEIDDVEGE